MAKLTDKQHKQIIARYAETQSYTRVAKEFGVSVTTIRRHCNGDKATLKKVTRKKEQNTLDMLAYMDSRKNVAQSLCDKIMEAMQDPNTLAQASIRELATAFGIIVDKFTQSNRPNDELLQRASDILGKIDGVIK